MDTHNSDTLDQSLCHIWVNYRTLVLVYVRNQIRLSIWVGLLVNSCQEFRIRDSNIEST